MTRRGVRAALALVLFLPRPLRAVDPSPAPAASVASRVPSPSAPPRTSPDLFAFHGADRWSAFPELAARDRAGGHGELTLAWLALPAEEGGAAEPPAKTAEEERTRRSDRQKGRISDRPAEPTRPAEPGKTAPEATPPGAPRGQDAILDEDIDLDEHFEPLRNRWYIAPPAYEINEPTSPLNPYTQNVLKGDYPIIGEDIFLQLTATERLIVETRNVPTGTGISASGPGEDDRFFGDGEQFQVFNYAILEADLFKGQQAFKPVDWRLKATAVYNNNLLWVQEPGVVNIDVDEGEKRFTDDLALQQAFAEVHLLDLSDRYDFISVEAGIIGFRSDFRSFIFEDSNLGVRLFGNADANKWQYNLVAFDRLEKDTNSELNTFDDRDQYVVIANVYRQDFPFLGYTTSGSVHYNQDDDSVHFNDNGFLQRPKPAGLAQPHEVESVYLGWAGDGHIGRVNVTHAFYQVFGEEENNEFAGRDVDINAQLAAAEVSYDIDWLRPRLFGLYLSGDDDTRDDTARGFDGIFEFPAFAGGEASFFNRQEIRLGGVGFTQRLSPYVDLSSSKLEGQSNYVNPGLILIGAALDAELAPKWKANIGGSYLRLADTDTLEIFLESEDIPQELGWELFLATQYRPLLNNNIIVNVGVSPFFPGPAFRKVFETGSVQYSVFAEFTLTW